MERAAVFIEAHSGFGELIPPLVGLTVLFNWSYFTHYLPVHIPSHSQPICLYTAGAAGSGHSHGIPERP